MANTLNLGNGNWATKEDSLLAYNSENGNFKPLPFDFTRASSATVVNKAGLIETVGSGEPRIDYKDDAKGALLLEPQRSNLLSYSEPTSSETSAGGITYELFNWNLGFTNCIKFGDNSQTRYRYFTGTIANSTQYTISAFVIMDDLSEPVLGTAINNGDLIFRVGGIPATTGNLPNVNMGNNIYRLSSVITSASGGGTTGLLKYSGQSNKGFRIVGFQVEQGSYATSYIPTQGSVVTRVADVCNNGANEQVINSTEGVLYAEISALSDDVSKRFIILNDNSGGNRVEISYWSTSNTIQTWVQSSNSLQYYHRQVVSNIKDTNKVAINYKNNDFSTYINGVKVDYQLSGNAPLINTLNKVEFRNGAGADNFYGNTKDLRVYNTALTDQELQALTTL